MWWWERWQYERISCSLQTFVCQTVCRRKTNATELKKLLKNLVWHQALIPRSVISIVVIVGVVKAEIWSIAYVLGLCTLWFTGNGNNSEIHNSVSLVVCVWFQHYIFFLGSCGMICDSTCENWLHQLSRDQYASVMNSIVSRFLSRDQWLFLICRRIIGNVRSAWRYCRQSWVQISYPNWSNPISNGPNPTKPKSKPVLQKCSNSVDVLILFLFSTH